MIKELWNSYKLDTPIFWRNIGNSMMIISAFTGGFFLTYHLPVAAYIALYSGICGSLLTELRTKQGK